MNTTDEFDTLVIQLRYCATNDCMYDGMEDVGCTAPHEEREGCFSCEDTLMMKAADAIEKLSKEQEKGEWLEDYDGFEPIYRCSKCSEKPLTKYGTMHDYVLSEFCPHCGAEMM